MEVWNNEYYSSKILAMIKKIDENNKKSFNSHFQNLIYTEENITRLLNLEDIVDICNSLYKGKVNGGSKKDLEGFLLGNKNIHSKESNKLILFFNKTIKNFSMIFDYKTLKSSLFTKRTHFISLFFAIAFLINEYYILNSKGTLSKKLTELINNQPENYKNTVLGGIKQKAAREVRVRVLKKIIIKHSNKLDNLRFFDKKTKQTLWKKDHVCKLCNKNIKNYKDAAVDHIIPWGKGGKTEINNAQLTHSKCNSKKSDRWEEYIAY